jgi:hypothetical protein
MSEDNSLSVIGYMKEYYVGLEYIGKQLCEKEDRKVGYYGKKTEVSDCDIKFHSKKIKAGTTYTTLYFELNGR